MQHNTLLSPASHQLRSSRAGPFQTLGEDVDSDELFEGHNGKGTHLGCTALLGPNGALHLGVCVARNCCAKAITTCFSKKGEMPCAWPEIHGNSVRVTEKSVCCVMLACRCQRAWPRKSTSKLALAAASKLRCIQAQLEMQSWWSAALNRRRNLSPLSSMKMEPSDSRRICPQLTSQDERWLSQRSLQRWPLRSDL